MTDEIKWGRGLTGPYLKSIGLPGDALVKLGAMTATASKCSFEVSSSSYHLPDDSIVYQVLDFNEKHGTNFTPWFGGKNAPEDWDGGKCLFECVECWVPAGPESFKAYGLIIGYTRKSQSKPEPFPIDWSKPIELIADGTPLVVLGGGLNSQGEYRVGREDGAPLSNPDGSDSNGYWRFTTKGEFVSMERLGPLIRNRTSKPEPDDSEYVRVKRMTEAEWSEAMNFHGPWAWAVEAGIIIETPVERFKRENPGLTPDELLAKAMENKK